MKKRIYISERFVRKALFVWGVILSILYSLISVGEYRRYAPRGMDLGTYDQALWLYSRFSGFYNTVLRRHILGDHFTLTLPLLSPLYWIWDDVQVLLLFQAIWICLSLIPVYQLARIRRFSPWVSIGVAVVYSVFFGIQQAMFSDFHPVVVGTGLLLWVAYFFEAKYYYRFYLALVLLLCTQENMGIALVCLGIIYLFDFRYRRRAWWFIPVGLFATVFSMLFVAQFYSIGYEYKAVVSSSIIQNFQLLFDSPNKVLSWWYSYISFGFLPIFSVGSTLAVLVDMAQYFNTGSAAYFKDTPYTHHRIMLAPLLLFGLLETLQRLKNSRCRLGWIVMGLIILNIFIIARYRFPLYEVFTKRYWTQEQWMKDADMFTKRLPTPMKVSASPDIVPHIAHRQYIYVAELTQRSDIPGCMSPCWWLDVGEHAEYLLLRWTSKESFQHTMIFDSYGQAVKNMGIHGVLKEVDRHGEMVLFAL